MSVEPHTVISTRSVDPVPDSQPVLPSNTHASTINVPAVTTPLPPSRPASPDLRLRGGGKKKGKEEAQEAKEEAAQLQIRPPPSASFPGLAVGDDIDITRPGLGELEAPGVSLGRQSNICWSTRCPACYCFVRTPWEQQQTENKRLCRSG